MHDELRFTLAVCHGRSTRGGPLTFEDKQWLKAIYRDHANQIVIQKSSQIGISEFVITSMFADAMSGKSVMYVLPTDSMVYDFTPRRIDKLIASDELYQANCKVGAKDSDTKKQKTIFGTPCRIVGSNSEKNFFEFPCDVLIIDELDLCDQANLIFAIDRLGSSMDKSGMARMITRKIGNPSIAGRGINKAYEESDRKEWMIRCEHCGQKQVLDWFANFVAEDDNGWMLRCDNPDGTDALPLCRECDGTLDRLTLGEWVAQYSDRDVSGYHASQLFGDVRGGPIIRTMFAKFIEAQSDQTELQHFYNQVLGLPFKAVGSGFALDILAGCKSECTMPSTVERSVAGVDVGRRLHVHIETVESGIRTKVFIGTVPDFDELHGLFARYHVHRAVIDHAPEQHLVEQFCRTHSGCYVCDYNLALENSKPIEIDHAKRQVRTKRTPSLDQSLAHYLEGRVSLPKNFASLDNGDFVKQMCQATRVEREQKISGIIRKVFVWDDAGLPDHHQHADNYARIAADMGHDGSLITAI